MNSEIKTTVDQVGDKKYPGAREIPQNIDAENAVIGAVLIDPRIMSELMILTEDCFYSPINRIIWKALSVMSIGFQKIDLLTVVEFLKKSGDLEKIGGPAHLSELTNLVASSSMAPSHALFLKEQAIRRKSIESATKTIQRAYDPTFDALLAADIYEREAMALNSFNINKADSMHDIAIQVEKEATELERRGGQLTGLATGISDFDKCTDGLQPTNMYVLAARPGMGKTAFVLSIAKNIAEAGIPVGIISLEMDSKQLFRRIAAQEAELNSKLIQNPGKTDSNGKRILTDDQLRIRQESIAKCAALPIHIDDDGGMTIAKLRSVARKLKSDHGIKLLIVDYLQLMSGADNSGSRESDVSEISRGFKAICKELDIPGIALSQLSRAVEGRGGMRIPRLSDLRESGSIEQDADLVGFIHRPEYYDILEDDAGVSLKGFGQLIVSKNRHGELDTIKMKFDAEFTRFRNYSDDWEEKQRQRDPAAPEIKPIPPSRLSLDDQEDLPF